MVACRFEKMIAGEYLGEIVRQALLSLIKGKALFGGESPKSLKTFKSFVIESMSSIETG